MLWLGVVLVFGFEVVQVDVKASGLCGQKRPDTRERDGKPRNETPLMTVSCLLRDSL